MVILVALVSAVGLIMYTGASSLLGNWSKSTQVVVSGAYLLGDNIIVVNLKNTGNTPALIDSMEVYDSYGTNLANILVNQTIDIGKTLALNVTLNSPLSPGDVISVVLYLGSGEVIKYTVPLQ